MAAEKFRDGRPLGLGSVRCVQRWTLIRRTKSTYQSDCVQRTLIPETKSAYQGDCVPRRTLIPGTKSAYQGECVPRWILIPVTKSAHQVDCGRSVCFRSVGRLDSGRPVGLGSVRCLNWITSLALRVKRRRRRYWRPSRFRVRRPFRVRRLSPLIAKFNPSGLSLKIY